MNAILLGYINRGGGTHVDTAAVIIDLPNGYNISRSFSCHQEFVGCKIRHISTREMELTLEMELKATIIYEESEEYYEFWIKKDKKDSQELGSPICMVWDCNADQAETTTPRCLVAPF